MYPPILQEINSIIKIANESLQKHHELILQDKRLGAYLASMTMRPLLESIEIKSPTETEANLYARANRQFDQLAASVVTAVAQQLKILAIHHESVCGSVPLYQSFIVLMQTLLQNYRHIYYAVALEGNPLLSLPVFAAEKKGLLTLLQTNDRVRFIQEFDKFLFGKVYQQMAKLYQQYMTRCIGNAQTEVNNFFLNYLTIQPSGQYTDPRVIGRFHYYALILNQIDLLLLDDKSADDVILGSGASTAIKAKDFLSGLSLFMFLQGSETFRDLQFPYYEGYSEESKLADIFKECYGKSLLRFPRILLPLGGNAVLRTPSATNLQPPLQLEVGAPPQEEYVIKQPANLNQGSLRRPKPCCVVS